MAWQQQHTARSIARARDARSRQPGAPPQPPVARRRRSGPRSPSRSPSARRAHDRFGRIRYPLEATVRPAKHPFGEPQGTRCRRHTRCPRQNGRDIARGSGPVAGTTARGATSRPPANLLAIAATSRKRRCRRPVGPPDALQRAWDNVRVRSTRALRPRRASATTPRSPGDTNEKVDSTDVRTLARRSVPEGAEQARFDLLILADREAWNRAARHDRRAGRFAPHRFRRMPFRRHVDVHTGKPAHTDVAKNERG